MKIKNNVIKAELNVVNTKVSVMKVRCIDYMSLTDLTRYVNHGEPKIPSKLGRGIMIDGK